MVWGVGHTTQARQGRLPQEARSARQRRRSTAYLTTVAMYRSGSRHSCAVGLNTGASGSSRC